MKGPQFVEWLNKHGLKNHHRYSYGYAIDRALRRWEDGACPHITNSQVMNILDELGLGEHDIPHNMWTDSKKNVKRKDSKKSSVRYRKKNYPEVSNVLLRFPPANHATTAERKFIKDLHWENPRRWPVWILAEMTRVAPSTIVKWINEEYSSQDN